MTAAAPVREEGGAVDPLAGWTPHDGVWGKPPAIAPETIVLVLRRNGSVGGPYRAGRIEWHHQNADSDPLFYRPAAPLATREVAPAKATRCCDRTTIGPWCDACKEAPAEAGEIDLYDDKVQVGIAWTMRQWGETLGLKTWDMGDGSESVEGDVGAEIHTILVDAGLRDPETNEMATLRAQPPAREDAQPVAWRVEYRMPNGRMSGVQLFGTRAAVEFAQEEASQPTTVSALYTHPAPDALREAVEALKKAASAISSQYALAQAEYQHLEHLATKHDKIVQEGRRAIREALAALQAEQGAK